MKRIQLFEFEDLNWFPNWLRVCMTRYINTVHRILGSPEQIAGILADFLPKTGERHILDLCSGAGGPMPEVLNLLRDRYGFETVKLTLSDLYPNPHEAKLINSNQDTSIRYQTSPVDARTVSADIQGIRSLICSFHHMAPESAKKILSNAVSSKQPIFIYEISDNSFPKMIWWIAIPINILTVLAITPLVRPMSLTQIVFTYLIPVLPLFIAWDGAVSNARTYTLSDLDELISEINEGNYSWKKGLVKGKGGPKLYLIGHTPLN